MKFSGLLSIGVILFLRMTLLYSQDTAFIKGVLLDAETKEPVVFATVRVKGKALGVISNKDGSFKVPIEFQFKGTNL